MTRMNIRTDDPQREIAEETKKQYHHYHEKALFSHPQLHSIIPSIHPSSLTRMHPKIKSSFPSQETFPITFFFSFSFFVFFFILSVLSHFRFDRMNDCLSCLCFCPWSFQIPLFVSCVYLCFSLEWFFVNNNTIP